MIRIYNSFVPNKDAELVIWAGNIIAKIDEVGTLMGLSAEQIANWKKPAQTIVDNIGMVESRKRDLDNAVATKEKSKTVELASIRASIAHLKTLPGYSNGVGGSLGIVSASYMVDEGTIKPMAKVKAENGIVKVQFKKMRQPGVNIYCRLQGASTFEKLGYDYASPFLDTRSPAVAGQPEIREYKVVCSDGKLEIGRESDIVSVLFGG